MRHSNERGLTLIEVLLATAIAVVTTAVAMPMGDTAVDEMRTGAAARYLAGRIVSARMDAARRSTAVAIRFEGAAPDYLMTPYADGNDNGVRSLDIRRGVDPAVGVPQRLADSFPGVRFGLRPDLPDIDGVRGVADGVRIGAAKILTLGPDGTATSGTLYVQGRAAQYAVRILGATGRTRVMRYDGGARAWIAR
jgi:type II secretory pathway pseudopilin PulG